MKFDVVQNVFYLYEIQEQRSYIELLRRRHMGWIPHMFKALDGSNILHYHLNALPFTPDRWRCANFVYKWIVESNADSLTWIFCRPWLSFKEWVRYYEKEATEYKSNQSLCEANCNLKSPYASKYAFKQDKESICI